MRTAPDFVGHRVVVEVTGEEHPQAFLGLVGADLRLGRALERFGHGGRVLVHHLGPPISLPQSAP